jgi:hypothetical protein
VDGFCKEDILRISQEFVEENGEDAFYNYLFPEFMNRLTNTWLEDIKRECYEKGENDVKGIVEYELQEMKMKFEDVTERYEAEKETVLLLRSDISKDSLDEENDVGSTKVYMNIATNTDDFEYLVDENEPIETEVGHELLIQQYEDLKSNRDFLQTSLDNCRQQIIRIQGKVDEEITTIKTENLEQIKQAEDESLKERREKERFQSDLAIYVDRCLRLKEDLQLMESKLNISHLKFMDFHKSTLEELRKKDTENRQYSTELTREVISLNKKIQEEKRNTTCAQTESTYLKRQIEDYDQVQQECKRIRRENTEKCVQKSRCDSDIVNMKLRLEEVSTERDSLRKQNMQLENKVAILETSSQLESCRKSIYR